jgi:hypothetical protein
MGFIAGYFYRQSKISQKDQAPRRIKTYSERQKAKILYKTDADRIRQLNLLSPNESKFMRMLQHEFTNEKVIVKDKRFYIADQDNYPIAIFEYRDGTKPIKNRDIEDGLPLFLYKALLSSQSIKEDKVYLNS